MKSAIYVLLLQLQSVSAWLLSKSSRSFYQSTLSATANNNIVLAPSSNDDERFDSYTIGSARVHRYTRQEDSETEYVMWYHGRSKHMAETSTNLPPLSTGRIGRATSKNGLIWIKDTEGSASEDAPDVALGLNKESWWGFDTAHVGLGNVLLPMSTPAVMTEGGVYIKYYFGGSLEETNFSDYLVNPPVTISNATIAGMKMRIGVAVSQDGKSWGRVEGDDPTGACMAPHDKSDPNAKFENVPSNMPEELYCAWPEVVMNWNGRKEQKFLMYYSTMTKDTKEKCIAYAESEDGFRWTKQGLCMRPEKSGLDAGGVARCCVVRDAIYNKGEWLETDSWTMYYEGISPSDNKHRIMVATSQNGKNWKKGGLALDVGQEADSWDVDGVGSPHVLRLDDGSQRMYYTGQGSGGKNAIGVAKLSPTVDTGAWVREQATITFVDIAD
jgi:hypothetical protein